MLGGLCAQLCDSYVSLTASTHVQATYISSIGRLSQDLARTQSSVTAAPCLDKRGGQTLSL